ncbi:unnamed protein product, partial [Mesorhabditis spiculigera]
MNSPLKEINRQDIAETPRKVNMDLKRAFYASLRRAANKDNLANWSDVRAHYKKLTGRHLAHQDLVRISGVENPDKTKMQIFTEDFTELFEPIDPHGNVIRLSLSAVLCDIPANDSSLSSDGRAYSSALDQEIDLNNTAMEGQGHDADELEEYRSAEDLRSNVHQLAGAGDAAPPTTPVYYNDENIAPLTIKSYHYGPSFPDRINVGRHLPEVLNANRDEVVLQEVQALLAEKTGIREELAQCVASMHQLANHYPQDQKESAIISSGSTATSHLTSANTAATFERAPTWEKELNQVDSSSSAYSHDNDVVEKVEEFLHDCHLDAKDPDRARSTSMVTQPSRHNLLCLTDDLPEAELDLTGPAPPLEMVKPLKKKSRLHIGRHHLGISCCTIL